MTVLLEVERLTRRYPRPRKQVLRPEPPLVALDQVSFALGAGRTLGVVGESGSGKTTLARLVMGFETPDAGRIRLNGKELDQKGRRGALQMVFQDPFGSLDPRRPVGWSVAQPLRALGKSDTRTETEEALSRVGLSAADGARYPHEFSGGQRQRIAIARAIITRPRLLVADEAVSALDVSVRAQILNLLMDLQDAFGMAMLFISHDLAVVSSLCDDLIVLRNGKTIEHGPAQRILAEPGADYTQTLIAAAQVAPSAALATKETR
ncbi:ATP-binding cassette domain-containing protein [Lutimaribacter marinistellae]|uniref:ATP-binding cassette domain-containing protein n=1 Tax=Lutimaribacter marinistellae TaxID=1820329 RepID=A0ABV7TKT3_9RHOB